MLHATLTHALNPPIHVLVYLSMSLVIGLRAWKRSSLREWRDAADEGVLAVLHLVLALF